MCKNDLPSAGHFSVLCHLSVLRRGYLKGICGLLFLGGFGIMREIC